MFHHFSGAFFKKALSVNLRLIGAASIFWFGSIGVEKSVRAESPEPRSIADSGDDASAVAEAQAKITLPTERQPPFEVPTPYQTEDELIQHLVGDSPAATPTALPTSDALTRRDATPVFQPPGSTLRSEPESEPLVVPIVVPPPLPQSPPQVTVGTNSDLNLKLIDQAPKATTDIGCQIECLATSQAGNSVPMTPTSPRFIRVSPPVDSPLSGTEVMTPASHTPTATVSQTLPLITPTSASPFASPNVSPAGAPLPPLPTVTPVQPQQVRPVPAPGVTPAPRSQTRSAALTPPSLRFQGVNIFQGGENSARARVTGIYPLSPQVVVGATIDFTTGNAFSDSPNNGININELYIAAAPFADLPNLRFVVGQLDLTSYFDRNSFAKDGASHFFNTVFQTNPALASTGIGSRQAALVNWSVNDNIEAKATVFSSGRSITNFDLSGFAAEVGVRQGNFIVRGTYATNKDAGVNDGFREIFGFDRGNGRTGIRRDDREDSYGVNAEVYIPSLKMGIFGRYGYYYNQGAGEGGSTYGAGITFQDLLSRNDRFGIAYGRQLSNDRLRRRAGDKNPDVFEVYYDFALLPNLRLGFSYQALEQFSESIFGVRVKTEFDMVAPRR